MAYPFLRPLPPRLGFTHPKDTPLSLLCQSTTFDYISAPPQILVLHSFDDLNYPFADAVGQIASGCNVVSLFQHRYVNLARITRIARGIGARFFRNQNWQFLIRKYMDWADVIVVDVSHARKGTIEELKMLSRNPKNAKKVVLFAKDRDSVRGVLGQVRTYFPDKKILAYGDVNKWRYPPTAFHHPVVHAILSRLSTHYLLPLLPPSRQQKGKG